MRQLIARTQFYTIGLVVSRVGEGNLINLMHDAEYL